MLLSTRLRDFVKRLISQHQSKLVNLATRQLILQADTAAKSNAQLQALQGLHDVEFRAFSQWGEDGIIDWLVRNLPDIPQTFIEFGVEDYLEANTRLLIQARNWRGLVLDGSAEKIHAIRADDIYWRHDLDARQAFVHGTNINDLLASAGFTGDIGLLSIDIDGNDYWVWEAIDVVSPRIVVCEYNAVLGDLHALAIPYEENFRRTAAHHSNLYFGASLPAFKILAEKKGYAFLGTTSTGCNAFFIRKDVSAAICARLDWIWEFPSRVREARDRRGKLIWVGGADRALRVSHLPFVNLRTARTCQLGELGEIYSPEWSRGEARRLAITPHV